MRWFSSDLHLGHDNIRKYCERPFKDVDEMNQAIIDRWNEVVSEDDEVYVLGDVALGKIMDTLPLVTLLKGHKFLVPGNHDRLWSGNKKLRDVDIQMYQQVGFEILSEQFMLTDRRWLLCHFPYKGDSQQVDRHSEHRPVKGRFAESLLIHGHTHSKDQIKSGMVHVGVDAWGFRPVSEETVDEIVYAWDSFS